jgi:hypothetical protein
MAEKGERGEKSDSVFFLLSSLSANLFVLWGKRHAVRIAERS